MHSLPQEQDLNLIPVDLPTDLPIQAPPYLELDPSYHNVEGVMGDALIFLLTHATNTLDYLETAKYLCDQLEIKPTDLDVQKKRFCRICFRVLCFATELKILGKLCCH